MGISIFPMTPDFVAEIGDVDLRRDLACEDMSQVRAAFASHAVLIFPAQDLTTDQHLAIARNFGPLEDSVAAAMKRDQLRVRKEIGDIANLDAQGNIWRQDDRARTFQMMGNGRRSNRCCVRWCARFLRQAGAPCTSRRMWVGSKA